MWITVSFVQRHEHTHDFTCSLCVVPAPLDDNGIFYWQFYATVLTMQSMTGMLCTSIHMWNATIIIYTGEVRECTKSPLTIFLKISYDCLASHNIRQKLSCKPHYDLTQYVNSNTVHTVSLSQ